MHEKTLILIEELGLGKKRLSEVLGKSYSAIISKFKEENGNRFTADDFEKLKSFVERVKEMAEKL